MAKSSKIRLLYGWGVMGPYHAARMNALAARPEIELTVFRLREKFHQRSWELTADDLDAPLLEWGDIKKADLAEFDAAIFSGWFEPKFRQIAKRLPSSLKIVFSESNYHDRDRNPVKEAAKRQRLQLFDGGFAAGSLARDYFLRLGMPADRVAIVPNVADLTPFELARREHGFDQEKADTILYAGRLAPEKNLEFLFPGFQKAWEILKEQGVAVSLKVAGSGGEEYPGQWPDMIQDWGLDAPIEFLGETKPDELAKEMTGAAFLILPSFCEPWGLVVNEALAAGCPVMVSPACGCMPELVTPETGWILGGFEPENICKGILRAWRDRHRWPAMREAAAEKASEFTPEIYAEKVLEGLESIAAASGKL